MQEVSFHLPVAFNDGRDASEIVSECLSTIIDAFGGATVTDARGYWKSGGKLFCEDVQRITVAIDTSSAAQAMRSEAKLFDIAMSYANRLEQLALYFVHRNGQVAIYDCEKAMKEVA